MQYIFHAANLSTPTVESFQDYARKRFSQLTRYLDGESTLRASIAKISGAPKQFELTVQLKTAAGKQLVYRTVTTTITECVDKVNKLLRRGLTKK